MHFFIFGNNPLSEMLLQYLTNDGIDVEGYCLNEKYLPNSNTLPLPIRSIESICEQFGKENIAIYLAIGYNKMNDIRKTVFEWLIQEQIQIKSYIHPTAVIDSSAVMGTGNIVLEGAIIQPFVKVGNSNIVWEGCRLSHHSSIGSFNYLAPNVILSGRTTIKNNCFLGSGSITKNSITINDRALIGAASYVSKDIAECSVLVPARSILLDRTSDEISLM